MLWRLAASSVLDLRKSRGAAVSSVSCQLELEGAVPRATEADRTARRGKILRVRADGGTQLLAPPEGLFRLTRAAPGRTGGCKGKQAGDRSTELWRIHPGHGGFSKTALSCQKLI